MAENQFLALLEKEAPNIKAMLPDYIGVDRWWALAIEVSKSSDLQRIAQVNPGSLISALKKLADWGLELDGEEALIIPYGDEAQPQAMYKGLIRRVVEAGVAAHIYAELVREGEEVVIISGSHRELRHTPNPFAAKGKKIIGAYAVVTLANGLTDFELFNEDDIAAVQSAALRMAQRRKKDAGESPAWRFFKGEMIKKSVIRRLLKRLRGKRDTDLGNRYQKVLETEPSFEVEGTELPPDDLPTAKEELRDEVKLVTKTTVDEAIERNAKKLALTPEVMPKAPRKLSDDEQRDLIAHGRQIGLSKSDIINVLEEEFQPPCDLSERTTDQIPLLTQALDKRALDLGLGNDLNDAASVQDRLTHGERVR